ncbi:adhesion G protein-coupled receptor E1 isoform X2 [Amia ocellicauda]|uniref:adhesion G protein-coupled receptor E1 isoform X2 n=1 Tax=Amia ocellicauda TaxID=2972642 RepID=UPI003463A83C
MTINRESGKHLKNITKLNSVKMKGDCIVFLLVGWLSSFQSYNLVSTQDPCSSYVILNDSWHNSGFTAFNSEYKTDNQMSGMDWYRFGGLAGDMMYTQCLWGARCGTAYPVWMADSHPRVGDGPRSSRFCIAQSIKNDKDCCYYWWYSSVKACPGGYYVYQFSRPQISPSTYCASHSNCTQPVCGPNAQCQSKDGGCYCDTGYQFHREITPLINSSLCEDIDECVSYSGVCGQNSQCNNTVGSYYCTCNTGFRIPDGFIRTQYYQQACQDIDECSGVNNSVCGPNAHCYNNYGSYVCYCFTGFRVPAGITLTSNTNPCEDIDECVENPLMCGPNAQCINTMGTYTCSCDSGYAPRPGITLTSNWDPCQDINECSQSPPVCGPNAKCINTVGSHNCSCNTGYAFPVDLSDCQDINECTVDTLICGTNAQCENTNGSYNCHCDPGYSLPYGVSLTSRENSCQDINECALSICVPHAQCINTIGSYFCPCDTGFKVSTTEANKIQCDDIDECQDPSVCGPYAQCNNTAGSYKCSCESGYRPPKGVKLTNSSFPCEERELYFVKEGQSWKEALQYCRTNHMNLLSIINEKQHQDLLEKLNNEAGPPDVVWMGLKKHMAWQRWYWTDKQPLQYSHWAEGQPSHPFDELCGSVQRVSDKDYEWHDVCCYQNLSFICY